MGIEATSAGRVALAKWEGDTMAMPADSVSHLLTAEELEQVDIPGKSTELVQGRLLVREPPSTLHGGVAARLTYEAGVGHRSGAQRSSCLYRRWRADDHSG